MAKKKDAENNKMALNLSINPKVKQLAEKVMELRGHSSFSAFVEELIRDEYERRNGPMRFVEEAADRITKEAASKPSSEGSKH